MFFEFLLWQGRLEKRIAPVDWFRHKCYSWSALCERARAGYMMECVWKKKEMERPVSWQEKEDQHIVRVTVSIKSRLGASIQQ